MRLWNEKEKDLEKGSREDRCFPLIIKEILFLIFIYVSDGREEKSQLNCPGGLSFDSEGNLYVVDWGNNRIAKFEREKKTWWIKYQHASYHFLR